MKWEPGAAYASGLAAKLIHSLKFPAAATDIERMTASAGMSPFGRGSETVFDPTYRRASEYKVRHTHPVCGPQLMVATQDGH